MVSKITSFIVSLNFYTEAYYKDSSLALRQVCVLSRSVVSV